MGFLSQETATQWGEGQDRAVFEVQIVANREVYTLCSGVRGRG